MILEVAILKIKPKLDQKFEQAFEQAATIIADVPGYIKHDLQKCLEVDNQYLYIGQVANPRSSYHWLSSI